MTSDKSKNHSQQSGVENSRSTYKNGKSIHKRTNIKQQKQKLKNKCPMALQLKQQRKISKQSSNDETRKHGMISDTESQIEEMNSSSIQESLSSSKVSQSKSSSFTKSQNNSTSMGTNFTQIKQEDIELTEQNSCIVSTSHCHQYSSTLQSSNEEQLYIRNRINHEPMLFLHNKWDILPNKDYNIFGDILIETDFVSDKKFSSQNHWKPPLNLEIQQSKMIAKMNIGSYGTTMREFSIISNFMKMCNHDQIQSYANNLDKWQQVCNKLVLSKQHTSTQKNINGLSSPKDQEDEDEIYAARLREFEAQCDRTFEELNKESKIFSYSKKRYNTHTQNLEEYECGFNQYLLAIMGCETEHLSSIIMRQGRPNFFDTKSRLKISQQLVMNYLNINLSSSQQIAAQPEYLQKVNLITFDDLQVPSSAYSYCMNFKDCKIEESNNQSLNQSSSSNSFNSSGSSTTKNYSNYNNTDYDFVLQIVELDIDTQHVSTLLNIREFNDHEQKLQDLKENIQYEFDIHILLQKYYKPMNSNTSTAQSSPIHFQSHF